MLSTPLLLVFAFAGGFLVAFVTASLLYHPDEGDRYRKEQDYRERKIPASEIRDACEELDREAEDEHVDGFRAGIEYAADRLRGRWDL